VVPGRYVGHCISTWRHGEIDADTRRSAISLPRCGMGRQSKMCCLACLSCRHASFLCCAIWQWAHAETHETGAAFLFGRKISYLTCFNASSAISN